MGPGEWPLLVTSILQQADHWHSAQMKILHGVVGCLAVTALPFHPFAFATPLAAINYDGYVDTTTQNHNDGTLVKHVLETCQTLTSHSLSGYVNATQNHSDSAALIKRASGDIMESRFAPEIEPPIIIIILTIITAITITILWINGDDPVRGYDDVKSVVKY